MMPDKCRRARKEFEFKDGKWKFLHYSCRRNGHYSIETGDWIGIKDKCEDIRNICCEYYKPLPWWKR